MKYLLYIDYQTGEKKQLEYIPMNAASLEEAIIEADAAWNPDRMYLIRIMKQTEKPMKDPDATGWKVSTYEAIICRRSSGWHQNTRENSEGFHAVKHHKLNRSSAEWYETFSDWNRNEM